MNPAYRRSIGYSGPYHPRSHAAPGGNQTEGLEMRNRFSNYGTADTEGFADHVLARQF